MSREPNRIDRQVQAGMDDREDVVVSLRPLEDGSGIVMDEITSEIPERVNEITELMTSILEGMDMTDLAVSVKDRGAQDFVIRARTLATLHRGMEIFHPGEEDEVGEDDVEEDLVGGDGGDAGDRAIGSDDGEPGSQEDGDRSPSLGMKLRRSRIYIPGNRPRMILKGTGFGADAVILDLEDSVPPQEKDSARYLVASALNTVDFGGSERMVRINPLDTYGVEDLETVLPFQPDAIVLPKCENVDQIRQVEELIGINTEDAPIAILPLIETAKGVLNCNEIASCSDRVEALTFGGEDFTRDIGAERTREGDELFLARSMMLLAAKAAGKQALDTVFADVKDHDGLRRDTLRMKRMGFDGKGAIHPGQIAIINEVYTPSESEVQYAVDVVHAATIAGDEGKGIAVIRGKMIDVPVLRRAERTIMLAGLLGLPLPGATSHRN